MKLSTNTFIYPPTMNSSELATVLSDQTLESKHLAMKTTSKKFIGTVSEQEFQFINSWFPVGAACVLNG